ncbi:MAG: hydroxymethylglutaryl-CoA lyase [Desulfomonile tiedjei]|uniref:Hydroxymethylglutaryl-CoA lyase n=1 Tax=Desulfomonile tiedjei TaxID=2358 RepID=A0A9D6V4F7_9BACT|nr:hydroxymethylglutaryl-CoA lyase [Desulfomonile tiedjei]
MAVEDKYILLQEVGPRDGLQNEHRILTVANRVELVEELLDAGLRRIQIGSFVSPRLVPQMAGTDELWRRLRKRPEVRYSVLTLNARGLDLALRARIPHVEIYASASETHSIKNAGASAEDSLRSCAIMIESAIAEGVGVTAGVMCAFGCFFEGAMPLDKIVAMVARFQEKLPLEIGLADTSGMADPSTIRTTIQAVSREVPVESITLHLHDTRGLGIQNMIAAVELGVRRFDTSLGGLGGCPFIPGAPGNISTERAVETLHSMEFETGVNAGRIASVWEKTRKALGR